MAKVALGIDFGTLSGRAVLVDVATGEELASSVHAYPHAVMDRELPDGTPLGVDWALQVPQDYLDALRATVRAVVAEAGVDPREIIGIGLDCTSSTMLPVRPDGTPLCELPAFRGNPHAYVKLWKHHAAQGQARRMQAAAEARQEPWLPRYGGVISSEWALPKLLQLLEEAPEVCEAMYAFIEVNDWLVWRLTGVRTRNACSAGYKSLYHKREGFPGKDYFEAVSPRLAQTMIEELREQVVPLGRRAGDLTAQAAAWLGLPAGIAVAVGNVDAHVTVPAVGITGPGTMLAILGTSTCHMLVAGEETQVPGMCGVVEDGIYPALYGYEAGQSCVGDLFAWFLDQCLPARYAEEAAARGQNIHAYLREKAERLRPGESGLLALDWWNGNRSVLVDADLTGVMLGMTLATRPEEIYRALIEATAFGTRKIIESFRQAGVPVEAFYASGGIAQKDPMTMQIYADVIRMPIRIGGSRQGAALGSAIYGAVAAGRKQGGYDSIFEAARAMGRVLDTVYTPIAENARVYDALYAEYARLHDYFGRGENDVMKRLKALKKQCKER